MMLKVTKPSKKKLAALLLLPVLWNISTPLLAAEEDTRNAETQATEKPLEQDPLIVTGKLENGMRYIIRPTKEPAGRGSVRLYVSVGSQNETDETSGISHFLEHMVFNGSRTFKRGELIPTMQRLGLGFGGDANAYTSLLHTVYMLDLPNLDEKTVDFALTIVRDFADGATLEDDAIDHERGIVVSELKSRDSESYRAMIAMLSQLTEGTRLANYMPIGKEEVIRNAPYELVRNYYRSNYVPERMTLILTGDFTPETAKEWITRHFATMEARCPAPAPEMGELKQPITGEKLINNPEAGNCTLIAAIVKPWEKKADTIEQRIEDMPMQVALLMLNRRFSRLSREESCPFISANMDESSFFHASSYTGLSFTSTPQNWQPALALALQQVRQAIRYGFSEEELNEAISALLTAAHQACDTWETVDAKTMASSIVEAVSEDNMLTAPQEDIRALQAGIRLIQANPDICRRALVKAFDPEKVCLTMTGALPQGITEAQLRDAYNEQLSAEVPEPTKQALKPFAYDTIGMPGSVVEQGRIEELGVTTLTLSNGVRVSLKPIDFRKSSITVTAAVDGGAMALPRLPGIRQMTKAVMSAGGLQEHSMDDLQRIFAGNQVTMNFGMDQTHFIFQGSTNMQDLELQCKLLAAAILYPGFRPEGERALRRKLPSQYKELNTTPNGAQAMQLPRALMGDNPAFVIPAREELEQRSTAEVKELLTPMLHDNALEVSLVGDFKVEDVLPVLERTFGAMPKRSDNFRELPSELRHVEFRPWGQRTYLRYPTELDKTLVTHVRPAGNGRDLRRNRRLMVLSSIVREKLFDGLRAVMGESYSPRVQVVANAEYDNAAYITCTSAGVKGNRAKVSAAMESICNGIGQGLISQEDFDCALRPFITSIEKLLVTPGFWVDAMLDVQSRPDKRELIADILRDARSITLEEIRDLARDVFGKDNADFFFTVPEDYDENATAPAAEDAPPAADEQAQNHIRVAPGEYVVISSLKTVDDPEWSLVVDTLAQKYPDARIALLPELNEESLTKTLQRYGARYAALVLQPKEVDRTLVNAMHRASRHVDSDPFGDCLWGIVTGYSASDAMRIAKADKPLIIKRVLSTTNVHHARFEHSYCITDWTNFPVLEQSGYTEPTQTTYSTDTPEGQDIVENGIQGKFAEQLSTQRPQLLVTSSHATPFNLEMPFGKGLIFPSNNTFYQVDCKRFISFTSALKPALAGQTEALHSLVEAMHFPAIAPDNTPRVWLAAGNCLMGDAHNSDQSMVVTALSAYTCNQYVGYTVPSWYGEAGWGTLSLFMGNTDGTTLAEAFFLNNQFILEKTILLDPKLMNVRFNDAEIGPTLQSDMHAAELRVTQAQARDALGLVHDRDTLAFFGDPAWAAVVDSSHQHAPLRLSWQDEATFTLTANQDYEGRAAVWFPSREIGDKYRGCNLKTPYTYTNDFLLMRGLKLKAGESITVRLRPIER